FPVRALVLTPTRELAAQVEESVRAYGKYLPLKSMVMFGGGGINPQIDALKRGVDIVVATPGRLLDHVGQRTIDLSHIELLVLDEADRML
ncbi:DEAD/DEAH box helicase, partial [Acinetobacter baumannii]